uniref:Fatty acid desaturase n=1 Tax=Cyanothece sp. (strain PCC 7425 / ATCC 29141) TaxID=395961 RepID=B8HKZ0_CYAP4
MVNAYEEHTDQQNAQRSASPTSLNEILKTIPDECFQQDPWQAWGTLFTNLLLLLVGYGLLIAAPQALQLPLCFFVGTTFTRLFVLAHDCGHYSFAQQKWINDWVGQLLLLPLLYPLENWRIRHNCHHIHTNKLGGKGWKQFVDIRDRKADPVWFPLRQELWHKLSLPNRAMFWLFRGPLWWIGSVINWWQDELLLNQMTPLSAGERHRVRLSIAAVFLFATFFFPTLIYFTGIWGLIKYWLMPWLVFHFWMSVFTRIQHSSPDVPWRSGENWTMIAAQLGGTVHCDYPWGIEFLCHHINVHIPHHLSVRIPHYHLRKAHQALKQHWGEHIKEVKFSWPLLLQMGTLHLYDEQKSIYSSVPFRDIASGNSRSFRQID